jgi:ribosomal protein L40E
MAYSAEIEQNTIEAGNGQLAAYGVQLTRMGNFDVNLSPEDEKQLKQLAKDTSYSQLAGGFQNYAAGEMALGAGQGMAQGGAGVDGAFLGAGFGLASAFGAQQAQAQAAQQAAAQQAAQQHGVPYGQPPGQQPPPSQAQPQQAPPGVVCASCQAANPPGAKFCMSCGQRMAPTVQHCTECGSELPAGARFCSGCGTQVGA